MTSSRPNTEGNRFAVPAADLDAVRVPQAQMVELAGDGHRPPPSGGHLPAPGDALADADGE